MSNIIGKLFRKAVEKSPLDAVGKVIASFGIGPNTVTFISLPLAFMAAYFIYIGNLAYAAIFIILAIIIDNLDGAVARAAKRETTWGSYLDAMVDKYVEMVIYIGFALGGFPLEAILVAAGTMLNSYAKPAAALRIPIGNEDWPALGERAERLLFLIIGTILAVFYPTIGGYSTISITLLVIAVLVNIGAIQRMLFARKLIASYEKTGKKQMLRK